MSLFKMYSLKNKNKEAINKTDASNKDEAITIFTKIKNLTSEQFKKLFKVEKIKSSTSKKI